MNWMAPWDTPKRPGANPLYRPRTPSYRASFHRPSGRKKPHFHYEIVYRQAVCDHSLQSMHVHLPRTPVYCRKVGVASVVYRHRRVFTTQIGLVKHNVPTPDEDTSGSCSHEGTWSHTHAQMCIALVHQDMEYRSGLAPSTDVPSEQNLECMKIGTTYKTSTEE